MTRFQTLALSALTLGTFLTVAPIVGAPLICLAIGAAAVKYGCAGVILRRLSSFLSAK